jgi:hypothetical protein
LEERLVKRILQVAVLVRLWLDFGIMKEITPDE